MATPKQVLYQPVDVDDAEFVDFAEADPKLEEENAEFEKFKAEMHDAQDDAKIMVGKKLTDSRGRPMGKQVFECFECGIDDYSFSQLCTRIRDDFGTGLYQILGRDSNGKYKFRKIVGVQAPFSDAADNVPAGTDVGMLIDKFSDAMQRQQIRTEAMFAKIAGPQTGGDAFDQMTKMLTAMGGMMGTMGMTPQPQKSFMDEMTQFKMMQEMFSGGDSGGGDANMFSLLTETVKSFGPLLGAAIMAQQKAGAIPASGPIQPLLASPETEKTTLSAELETMRPQIDFLVAQAKAGAKPADVAAAIIPGVPENSLEALEQFLQRENAIDICAQVNAGVDTFRAWFMEWREIMLKTIAEMFETPPEADHPPEAEPGKKPDHPPEVLTGISEQEQTDGAVAGHDAESAEHSAATATVSSDVEGAPAGDSGDAGNA